MMRRPRVAIGATCGSLVNQPTIDVGEDDEQEADHARNATL